MIPDFRTFIGESIWSDIHKRSNGIQNRKEDDINNLDLENFCEYLNKTYKCASPTCIVFHKDHAVDDFIAISLYTSESGYDSFLFYDGLIVTTQLFVVEDLGILSEVKSKYTVKIFKNDFDYDCISIYPKDKSTPVTNKFLIEILDYLLDKIDVPFEQNIEKITDVKESIWADIHKRSNGVQIRKEDDYIDKLDFNEFIHYLDDTYESTDSSVENINVHPSLSNPSLQLIQIPIEKIGERIPPVTINYQTKGTGFNGYDVEKPSCVAISSILFKSYPELADNLEREYDLEYPTLSKSYIVDTKSGPMKNSDCIKILDIVLSTVKEPVVIKKLGESVWADIHKRSNGKQERKEDDVNLLDMHDFLEYINKKYEFKDKKIISLSSLIGIPLYSHSFNITYLFISYYNSPYNSCDRIYDVYSRLTYDSPLKNDITSLLKQKYSVKILKEHSASKFDSRVFANISTKPKNGDINNEFVIDVIDTYIDIMDNFEDIDKQIKRK